MTILTLLIDAVPFALYTVLLFKSLGTWKMLRNKVRCGSYTSDDCRSSYRRKINLLMAILSLLTLCTLTFMASNAYALFMFDRTLLSVRVFQLFVVSNCAAYWLVLDLISRDASLEEA